MKESRFKKHLKRRAVQNIILALFGIIVVLGILFSFGDDLLIKFSLFTEKIRGSSATSNTSQESEYIAPPTLNLTESATNSAKINIAGYAIPQQSIKLYVNGELADTTDVKKDKSFTFKNIQLTSGENDIKAKAITEGDKQSDYSPTIKITYVNKPPSLEVNSLSDGQSFSKDQSPLKISGKTEAGNKVTINELWAILDSEGGFSRTIPLQNGENKIKIEATDEAGNKTTKEFKVTYSP